MEALLDLYEEPVDPARPRVCFDERPAQLLADARESLPTMPGRPAREDCEYRRRRILRKLEFHYTPVHGSWLNIAEAEIAAMSRPCLRRRIGDMKTLQCEVAAWQQPRNQVRKNVDWRFATADARVKLKRLYPKLTE